MSKAALSTRQMQVAQYVARGLPDKRIAAELNLDIETVRVHIQNAAAKLPGDTPRRHRLTLWYFGIVDSE